MMNLSLKKIAAAAAVIISLGGAAGVIGQYRWWPWLSEFNALAAETYKTSITQEFDLLLILQSRLADCEARKTSVSECNDLRLQERERQQKIEELQRKQDKVKEGTAE